MLGTVSHFKQHHPVLLRISNRMCIIAQITSAPREVKNSHLGFLLVKTEKTFLK